MTPQAPSKPLLYEVSIIRPLVIFLLVIYHSLCIFTGGWKVPDGVAPNECYWWLGHLISGFRIETIAFVGGYVFAYQCIALNRRANFFRFAWKKFKRLIIPCWIFGICFFFMFRYSPSMRWSTCMWKVLNGVEHLWFLPMLFWCFLLTWGLDRLLRLPADRSTATTWQRWALPLLLTLTAIGPLVAMPGLRLGLTRVPHFIFYFFLGYAVWYLLGNRQSPHTPKRQRNYLTASIVCAILYLALLLFYCRLTTPSHLGLGRVVIPAGTATAFRTFKMFVAMAQTTAGIMALYLFVSHLLMKKSDTLPDYRPKPWIIWCSKVCYGTYVFHMFFMKWIIYYTAYPAWMGASAIGTWLLPWATSLLTFLFSVGLSVLLLKTRTGRWLIG